MHRCNRQAVIARQRAAERERRTNDDLEVISAILAAVAEWQRERQMPVISSLSRPNRVA